MKSDITIDFSTEWAILVPPNIPRAGRGIEDLTRCIGLLAASGGGGMPKVASTFDPAPSGASSIIVLNCKDSGPEQNGFEWRAAPERVEIFGESERGLCNGIYSFLSAMGISWPAPGQEILPLSGFSIACTSVCEPSRYEGNNSAEAPWRRFVPAGKRVAKKLLAKNEAFAVWAARNRYDVLIIPLEFASGNIARKLRQLKKNAGEYDISVEIGGHNLSLLVPRRYFLSNRDFFRLADGKRKKDHHFCPTNPGTIKVIGKEGKKLFSSAGDAKVYHLWPDKETDPKPRTDDPRTDGPGTEGLRTEESRHLPTLADTAWCSCPTCRAFTAQEQNRIGINAAADVLAALNPHAMLTFFEKPGEGGKIPMRKNTFKLEKLPEETDWQRQTAENPQEEFSHIK